MFRFLENSSSEICDKDLLLKMYNFRHGKSTNQISFIPKKYKIEHPYKYPGKRDVLQKKKFHLATSNRIKSLKIAKQIFGIKLIDRFEK